MLSLQELIELIFINEKDNLKIDNIIKFLYAKSYNSFKIIDEYNTLVNINNSENILVPSELVYVFINNVAPKEEILKETIQLFLEDNNLEILNENENFINSCNFGAILLENNYINIAKDYLDFRNKILNEEILYIDQNDRINTFLDYLNINDIYINEELFFDLIDYNDILFESDVSTFNNLDNFQNNILNENIGGYILTGLLAGGLSLGTLALGAGSNNDDENREYPILRKVWSGTKTVLKSPFKLIGGAAGVIKNRYDNRSNSSSNNSNNISQNQSSEILSSNSNQNSTPQQISARQKLINFRNKINNWLNIANDKISNNKFQDWLYRNRYGQFLDTNNISNPSEKAEFIRKAKLLVLLHKKSNQPGGLNNLQKNQLSSILEDPKIKQLFNNIVSGNTRKDKMSLQIFMRDKKRADELREKINNSTSTPQERGEYNRLLLKNGGRLRNWYTKKNEYEKRKKEAQNKNNNQSVSKTKKLMPLFIRSKNRFKSKPSLRPGNVYQKPQKFKI